jgi:hypothetical protein
MNPRVARKAAGGAQSVINFTIGGYGHYAMKPDRVLTENLYYDGPLLGIAELNGVPHIYEADSTDKYGDTYFLSPIDAELLALVLEDWAIWRRWDAAYKRGEVTLASHPALPHERKRQEELERIIGSRLKSDPMNRLYFRARFSTSAPQTDWDGTLVEWQAQ